MAISKIAGKVQTVLGMIDGKDLGATLTHEHLFIDGKCVFAEPDGDFPVTVDHGCAPL